MVCYSFRNPWSCSCPWPGHMYHNLTRSCGRKVPDETLGRMLNCAIRHNRCFQFGGGVLHTKHHYWIHLIHQSKILGNPRLRSTMPNESLNGVVANVGKTCHRATFIVSVFEKLELLCRFKGNIMIGAHKETLNLKWAHRSCSSNLLMPPASNQKMHKNNFGEKINPELLLGVHIAEISVRYRRQNDRMYIPHLSCFHKITKE